MIKLIDYQKFCDIPSGSTVQEYNISVFELMNWSYDNLTEKEVQFKVDKFLSDIVENKKEVNHIKLGKHWYKIDKDLHTLKFPQWLYFDGVMKSVDKGDAYNKLHNVISSFTRRCRFYKWFPVKFDINKVEDVGKEIQEKLNIGLALQLTNAFFLSTTNFMNNTPIEYSEQLEKEIWELTDQKISKMYMDGT